MKVWIFSDFTTATRSLGLSTLGLAIFVSVASASEPESSDVVAVVAGDEIDKELVQRLFAPFADWISRSSLRPMDVYETCLVRQSGKDPSIRRTRSRLIVSKDSSQFLFTRMIRNDSSKAENSSKSNESEQQLARPTQMLSLIAEGPSAMFLDASVDTTWRSRGTENGMKRVKARDFRNLPILGASNLHFTFGKPMGPSSRLSRLPTTIEFHDDGSVTAKYESKKSKTTTKVLFSSSYGMLPVRMSSHILEFDEETEQYVEGKAFGTSISSWDQIDGDWILVGSSMSYHTPRAPASQRTSLSYEIEVKMRPKVKWAEISPRAPLVVLVPEVEEDESDVEQSDVEQEDEK